MMAEAITLLMSSNLPKTLRLCAAVQRCNYDMDDHFEPGIYSRQTSLFTDLPSSVFIQTTVLCVTKYSIIEKSLQKLPFRFESLLTYPVSFTGLSIFSV
jgi:hypothetical protein